MQWISSEMDSQDKLGVVFAVLKDVNWTLRDLFYHLFQYQDQDGNPVHRSPWHASYINQFLNGTSGKGIGFILDTWMRPMEGGPRSDETEQPTEFTMSVLFQNIHSAQPALTSFTAQLIKKNLCKRQRLWSSQQVGCTPHTRTKYLGQTLVLPQCCP